MVVHVCKRTMTRRVVTAIAVALIAVGAPVANAAWFGSENLAQTSSFGTLNPPTGIACSNNTVTWTAPTTGVAPEGYETSVSTTAGGSYTFKGLVGPVLTGVGEGGKWVKVTSLRGSAWRAEAAPIQCTLPNLSDPFTRADTAAGAGLGSVPSGPAWEVVAGTWQILSGRAHTTTLASNPIAVVDFGNPNFSTLSTTVSSGGGDALYFRVVDALNWWRVRLDTVTTGTPWYYTETTYYCNYTNGGLTTTGGCPGTYNGGSYINHSSSSQQVYGGTNYSTSYTVRVEKNIAGAVTQVASAGVGAPTGLRVIASGNTITPGYFNGSWNSMSAITDATHNTAVKHGIGRGPTTDTGHNLDNFVLNS